MVALIDDQMAEVADEVIDLGIAHKALDQRDVDAAGRLALAAANDAMSPSATERKERSRSRH